MFLDTILNLPNIMNQKEQVISEVVSHDLCIGCGICAGTCPSEALKMYWKDNGDRVPRLIRDCADSCSICLRVCPFYRSSLTENASDGMSLEMQEGLGMNEAAGVFLDSYIGYAANKDIRRNGASGGMTTWLLEELLNQRLIDSVICVGIGQSDDVLFDFLITDQTDLICASAGSKYYPVDMARALRTVMTEELDRRYAVVGLPCMLRALRFGLSR